MSRLQRVATHLVAPSPTAAASSEDSAIALLEVSRARTPAPVRLAHHAPADLAPA
jgi:hypothetical protein